MKSIGNFMKNLKINKIINFVDVQELKGLYIINQNSNVEKIKHIVDRENDFKVLRINGIYHKVSDLVFLKKSKLWDGLQEVEVRKIYSPQSLMTNGKELIV